MDPFPGEVFKKLKRGFFLDYAKTNVPKDSEIAGEIIEGLITSAQIRTNVDLQSILGLPFFKERIQNKAYYHDRLRLKSQQAEPLLDVKRLEETEYAEKVKEDLKKEAMEEIIQEREGKIEELEEKIKSKKEEYRSLPSILDGEDYPIQEVPESEEIPDQESVYSSWWDRLGLSDDPFQQLEGLDRIHREMWDEIVHKTEIFNRYEQIIEKAPKDLFRKIVVYGQFGSGKTTFFDYINRKLYGYKIYPIYIQLGGEFEVRELIFEFRRRMTMELSRLHTVIVGQGPQSFEALDDEQAIVRLLTTLSNHGAKGFVIFIDDLHKGDLEKAIKFMSHLQVLTSQISRASEQASLNLGFFVAGSPEWEKRMAHDDKFMGSVSHEERMPPLKPDVALDALNRRFKAFAKNPDNPRQFPRTFVEKIYKKLQYAGQDITFRRVMREVINEFEAGHFDALSIDPIKIPVTTLDMIKSALEKNLVLRGKFFKLIYGSKHLRSSQKRRCLELLVNVYLQNGLDESAIREADAPFLQQLHRVGLIVKVGIEDRLVWRITQDLWYINKQMIERHNLSLEDYLLKIYYADLPEAKRKVKRLGPEVEYLDALLSSMKQDLVRGLLEQARELHLMIIESGDKYLNTEEDPTFIINKCAESLARLTKAYQVYERLPVATEVSDLDTLTFWKDFWWSPEIIHQFVRSCTTDLEDKRRVALHIVSLYREAFPQIFGFFREQYEESRQFHIALVNLKNDEIKLLHECRDKWRENKYEELADKLAKYIERKLRTFLFNVFTVLYGDFERRIKWLDVNSRKYVLKNIKEEQSKGFSVSRNEFQQLNRAQYKNLMTGEHGSPEGRRNWNCIFSSVFRHWSEKDLDAYLNTFADINVKVSHMKGNSLGTLEQDYIYDFMQKSMRFMMDINQAYSRLLTGDCFKYHPPTNACLSLNKFNDSQTLTPIGFSKDDALQIKDWFLGKDKLKIPLDDQEYVEGITGLNYRKAYALLALLLTQTEEQQKKTKMKLEILNSKGCEIYVRLTKLDELSKF
jgi:hypothetical protein